MIRVECRAIDHWLDGFKIDTRQTTDHLINLLRSRHGFLITTPTARSVRMNEHHERLSAAILEAIAACECGQLSLEDTENTIRALLNAADSTYPLPLRGMISGFVQSVFAAQNEHLDEPDEDQFVGKQFSEAKTAIQNAMRVPRSG